jgi:hypothetical protein
MKTKDLIKQLQEVDPSGEGYIRMSGGVPYLIMSLPGYYDGCYDYIDENGNFVASTEGYKVDIRTMDIEGYVWDLLDRNPNITWEETKEKLILNVNEHTRDYYIRKAHEAFTESKELDEELKK